MMKLKGLLIFLTFFISGNGYSLIPIESLVLGDFSYLYKGKKSDPLEYIFERQTNLSQGVQGINRKKKLAYFRGFYEEGEKLKNYCNIKRKVKYTRFLEREETKRSVLATLQYLGIDLTVRAISSYAKELELSQGDYNNLVQNLMTNFCSKNITVISLSQLRKNLAIQFKSSESFFSLPSIKNNLFFPQSLNELNGKKDRVLQEFLYTVKLFRSFCSWGNDSQNLRLLVPLVKHPSIMAFVIRQMTNKVLQWDIINNSNVLKKSKKTIQVWCEDYICRKVGSEKFKKTSWKAISSKSMESDLKKMYCEDFRESGYTYKNQEPRVKKIIEKKSLFEDQLMVSQMIALISGIPDFLIWSQTLDDGIELTRSSIERSWGKWAKEQNKSFNDEILFEESFVIEAVKKEFYFNNLVPKFGVKLDVNLGEFDRGVSMLGKLKTTFKIYLPKSFLGWLRESWKKSYSQNDRKKMKNLRKILITHIKDQVENKKKLWPIPPWKKNLEILIAKELLKQLRTYRGEFFDSYGHDKVILPVDFYYGPFALKYLNYKFQISPHQFK